MSKLLSFAGNKYCDQLTLSNGKRIGVKSGSVCHFGRPLLGAAAGPNLEEIYMRCCRET